MLLLLRKMGVCNSRLPTSKASSAVCCARQQELLLHCASSFITSSVANTRTNTHLGAGVHSEAQLGLLAVVHRQALQQQGAQAGASTTTHSVEDQEALQASAVVGQLADAVQGQVNNLLADCFG